MNKNIPPWRIALSRALHRNRNKPYSKYLQLATVTKQGLPTNRTVVFRGFLPDSNKIQIVTDSRSDKIEEINSKPWGEICWYFTVTREQFRLGGKLTLVTADNQESNLLAARETLWKQLSNKARTQFAWPTPKQARNNNHQDFFDISVSPQIPLDNFCLLLLNPQQVDHLELRGNPQNRYLYTLDQGNKWLSKSVNP